MEECRLWSKKMRPPPPPMLSSRGSMLRNTATVLLAALAALVSADNNNAPGIPTNTTTHSPRPTYTVLPLSNSSSPTTATDDAPHLLSAFSRHGANTHLIFPANTTYRISSALHAELHNVSLEWRGRWALSRDVSYWRNSSHAYPIAFQNHRAAIIFSGGGISVDGHGTGGIDGGGDAWYDAERGDTRPGRPMPFVWWNVSGVSVRRFAVWQPPLWSINVMNGTNMLFEDMYVNATAASAPYGENWVQNTDGFDTMDVRNITLRGLVYQGGDDCIAIKPRSYDVAVQNVTCHGGNGVAIGSLGQYLEDSSVANVSFRDVHVIRHNEDLHNCAYIKTWMGVPTLQSSYESAGAPRGGGWGVVQNISFENVSVQGADSGPAITQDNGDNGTARGTSKMLVRDVRFANFSGYVAAGRKTAAVSCSEVYPCFGIAFEDLSLRQGEDGAVNAGSESCEFVEPGGVTGLNSSSCGAG